MPKRKATEEDDIPASDQWALKVESLFTFKVAVARNSVLRWLAALFLLRRWVNMFRMEKPRSQRYSRLPSYLKEVAQMVFPGQFAYRGSSGRNAPKNTSVPRTLQVMKVNDEAYDVCSRAMDRVLEHQSPEQVLMKTCVIARTYSRCAVQSSSLETEWRSVRHGVDLLIKDAVRNGHEPRELFTESFGPNCRRYNTCTGPVAAQKKYIHDIFPVDNISLSWTDSEGGHLSKEEIFLQLLTLPGTGKNMFQMMRRCVALRRFAAAAGNTRNFADARCAFSGPGSRMAVDILLAEAGGRGFLRNANSAASLRHFHPKVMFLQRAFMKELRGLCANMDGAPPSLLESFKSEDETCFIFTLCETWKVLCYLATGDGRYELELLDDE